MAVYWMSFHIDHRTIGGRDYEARWGALQKVIENVASSLWEETTAFVLFESANTMNLISTAMKSAIAPSHDLVLIRKLDAQTARVIGKVDDPKLLKSLMSYVERT